MEHAGSKSNIRISKGDYRRVRAAEIKTSLIRDKWLYFMLIPGVLIFLIFRYGPMFGLVMAFQNYQPFSGVLHSKWVGFSHFNRLFNDPAFLMLLKNTLILGIYNIVFFFPMPIIISLLINEARRVFFKRFVQTMIYIPHFLSWVVVASITYTLFTIEGGVVNNILAGIGADPVNPLLSISWFRPMIILQLIWKETGWGTIIILAALAGVSPELYSAAEIDGANRWHRLIYITLPSIRSTIVILLILRLSSFMSLGFEQVFLMINAINREVGEIFDTYIWQTGIVGGQFSYTTAVGLFKSVVSLVMVFIADKSAKLLGEEGIY